LVAVGHEAGLGGNLKDFKLKRGYYEVMTVNLFIGKSGFIGIYPWIIPQLD